MPAVVALLRPHQWIKNLFVVAPLFFTPQAMSWMAVWRVALGVLAFSALASAIYVVNDWRDQEADRQHPVKRLRPLASRRVEVRSAFVLAACLALGAILASLLFLPRAFLSVLLGYGLLNVAYSYGLKRLAIIDVMMIAIGFVLRIYAGGALIHVTPTVWIVACTLLLALFLALAKRRDDLVRGLDRDHRESLEGYNRQFLDTALGVVLAALLVCYLLYTTQPDNMHRLGSDKLFLTAPFVIAGVLRYLQITLVDERSGSPTRLVVSDPFLLLDILAWLATFAWLIYG